jgi:hypothetical protein
VPFAARDFRAVQPAADLDLNSLGPKAQRLFHRLAHGAPKRDALLELRRNLLGLQLRIKFRFVNLLDRDQHFAPGARRNVALKLVNLRTLASDDNSRARGVDDDLQAVGGALDIDVRNPGAGEPLFQVALQLQVLDQEITELFFRKPVRMPVLVVTKAKSVWMNFLAQTLLRSQIGNPDLLIRLVDHFRVGPLTVPESAIRSSGIWNLESGIWNPGFTRPSSSSAARHC